VMAGLPANCYTLLYFTLLYFTQLNNKKKYDRLPEQAIARKSWPL